MNRKMHVFLQKAPRFLMSLLRNFDDQLSSQGSNNPQDMCAEKKNIYRESFVFLLRGRREQNVMGRTNCLSEASFWEAHVISTL